MKLTIALVIAATLTVPIVEKKLSESIPFNEVFEIPAETETLPLKGGLKFVASETGGSVHLELEEGSIALVGDDIPVNGTVNVDIEPAPGVSVKGTISLSA